MAIVEFRNIRFRYPQQREYSLQDVTLTVEEGEFIVLCGPSGCGKTTLLRQIKSELRPVGELKGDILFKGLPLGNCDPAVLTQRIGFVQQDPDNQIVMEKVVQELAFGLENMAVAPDDMRRRMAELVHLFGMEDWLHQPTAILSGGQKQILNLVSVLLLRPDVLLLDEPTAQLDPVAARQFLHVLRMINEEFGLTVIISEHRLEELFPSCDRVIFMDTGGIVRYRGAPAEVIRQIGESGDKTSFEYLPSLAKLALATRTGERSEAAEQQRIPLTIREGREWLTHIRGSIRLSSATSKQPYRQPASATDLVACTEVGFQYASGSAPVLKQLDLAVREGDFLAIVGGNGSGKSTLLKLLAGLLPPRRGKIRFRGEDLRSMKDARLRDAIGYLPQNVMSYFLHETIEEEIQEAAARSRRSNAQEERERLIRLFGLESVLGHHPHDVSGGERQKAALLCVLLAGPELLLLDEPTKGMDPNAKRNWGELLQTLNSIERSIVLVTHDVEFAAQYASRCVLMFDGALTADGSPQQTFGSNYFYTTAMNRLVRDIMPSALTYKDVLDRWPAPVSPL